MEQQAEWTKLTVRASREDLEVVTAVMGMLDNGLLIEDYSDFPFETGMYGDLVDETIKNADPTRVAVSIFVAREKNLNEYIAFLRERFAFSGIRWEYECEGLREEDWAESWKRYYHPIAVGDVTIVPAWQNYRAKDGETVVRMDPGMAFGAGTHETTRLAVLLLEETVKVGDRVLDVGTGSGILSIVAEKLGASLVRGYDIDPVAVRVARENAAANGTENVFFDTSDLLASVETPDGGYDLAVANIVCDVLLRMAPDLPACLRPGARLICSGIIEGRLPDLRAGMSAAGFREEKVVSENDWYALRFVSAE